MHDYDENAFKDVLMPQYQAMVTLFREKIALADTDTQEWYPKLIGFVSMWERRLAGALPADVVVANERDGGAAAPVLQPRAAAAGSATRRVTASAVAVHIAKSPAEEIPIECRVS